MLPLQLFCCVFAVALTELPYGDTVCIPSSFLLRATISQKKATACPHMKTYTGTVEQCKIETCRLGLNTFNYNPTKGLSYIKRCADGDIMLIGVNDYDARDVYSLFPACTDASIVQVKRVSDGVSSSCTQLESIITDTMEECRQAMCSKGGNTFNFNSNRPTSCATNECSGGSITYQSTDGGFNVYTTLACYNDNDGCDHNCHDSGIMTSCSCRSGFTLQSDKKSCQDDDECASSPCNHTCTNTPGSFKCSCEQGYELNPNQRDCTDVDECHSNHHLCEQQCKNTPGSYICECRDGYRLEGQTGCTNVDECTGGQHDCNQTCTDTVGSYTCSCTDGFVDSLDNKQCHDIDECAAATDLCEVTCTNTEGAYICSCQEGYTLSADGHSCLDYCSRQFTMTVSKSGRVSSSCPTLKVLQGVTLEHSLHVACNISSNVINALDEVHVLKRCPSGEFELTAEHGGWDVYTRFGGRGQPVVQNAFPTWAIAIIVVALVVVVAVIVIVILFKRRASRTTAQRSEQPQQDKDQSATQGTAMTPDGGATRRLPEPVQMSLNPGEGVYEEIEEDRGLSSVKATPDHAYDNVHPPKKASNYDRLNKNEIAAPVITEYESMNI